MDLLQPPPRPRTREWALSRRNSALRHAVAVVVAGTMWMTASNLLSEKKELLRIAQTGRQAAATILKKETDRSGNSKTYYVSYRYAVDGQTFEARRTVDDAFYETVTDGAPATVIVDPGDPNRTVLNGEQRELSSRSSERILKILAALVFGFAIWSYWLSQREHWLWLYGHEALAEATPTGRLKYSIDGKTHYIAQGWAVIQRTQATGAATGAVVYDSARPERAMGITVPMLPHDSLETLIGKTQPQLPMQPRPDNPVWRRGLGTTASDVVGVLGPGCALVTALVLISSYEEVGLTIVASGIAIVVLLLYASLVLLHSNEAQKVDGLNLWRDGIEVGAAVVSDKTYKGERTVRYRFASGSIVGSGKRSFPAKDSPLDTASPITAVIVLVHPLDARRSRMVLRRERNVCA